MTTLVARPMNERVLEQLHAADVFGYITRLSFQDDCIRGVMRLDVLEQLRRDCYDERTNPLGRFREGPFSWLHPEIEHATEFRSEQDVLGEGSLQLSINQVTGEFRADVDEYASYQDARGTFAHLALEVAWPTLKGIGGWFKRRFKKGDCQ